MGIAKNAYSLLAELKRDFPDISGSVLQLGRQTVMVNARQALGVLKNFDIKSPLFFDSGNIENINDISLFKSLGFDSVQSVDYSNFENPTYIHDFNHPVSEELYEKFDAIYDGGTLEHIFNFPESLKNIYKMLKVNGIVMHASPSNNYVDHGFYSFSPTLFYDYYLANGFEILKSYVYEIEPYSNKCLVYAYNPKEMSFSLPRDGFGELLVWFVARKVSASTCNVVPQQGMYKKRWLDFQINGSDKLQTNVVSGSHSPTPIVRLRDFIKKSRLLYSLLLPIVKVFRGKPIKPIKPPVIAVYDYR